MLELSPLALSLVWWFVFVLKREIPKILVWEDGTLKRSLDKFGWSSILSRTAAIFPSLLGRGNETLSKLYANSNPFTRSTYVHLSEFLKVKFANVLIENHTSRSVGMRGGFKNCHFLYTSFKGMKGQNIWWADIYILCSMFIAIICRSESFEALMLTAVGNNRHIGAGDIFFEINISAVKAFKSFSGHNFLSS